ncbi:MAG: DUF1559 domain-containing protein [Fuerstiella sp.]
MMSSTQQPCATGQKFRRIAAPLWLSLLVAISAAAEADNAAARNPDPPAAAPIERYLDASTALVGWVDIAQIDLDAMTEFAKQFGPTSLDLTQPKTVQKALVQLGVARVFWVSDLAGLTNGPRAVIVPAPAEHMDGILLILKSVAGSELVTAVADDGCILVGNKQAVAGLQQSGQGKPDAALLAAVNNITHPHGLAVRTPASALIPVVSLLPGIFGNDSARTSQAAELLLSVQTVTVSGELPPIRGKLQITTKSSEAAAALAELINDWTTEKIGEAAAALHVSADGSDLIQSSDSSEEAEAVIGSLMKLISPARDRARKMSTMNSLKQIGLAMHNFHDSYGHFPPQALADDSGRRLLSWRVLILPYLDQTELYNQFHLDEPWDSDHNRGLIEKIPFVYDSFARSSDTDRKGRTRLIAPLLTNSVFGRPGTGVHVREITDGTSATLLVVEADPEQAVIWTKPEDIDASAAKDLKALLDSMADGFHACLCDGSARFFSETIDNAVVRALLTIDGGETIDWNQLQASGH